MPNVLANLRASKKLARRRLKMKPSPIYLGNRAYWKPTEIVPQTPNLAFKNQANLLGILSFLDTGQKEVEIASPIYSKLWVRKELAQRFQERPNLLSLGPRSPAQPWQQIPAQFNRHFNLNTLKPEKEVVLKARPFFLPGSSSSLDISQEEVIKSQNRTGTSSSLRAS